MTFETAEGGTLPIDPQGDADLGTSGKIEVPPRAGPSQEVTVTASLFGIPGEADDTTGGNVSIGQGIEWAVDDPDAVEQMLVTFFEAAFLTNGGSAQDAIAYKDGAPVEDAPGEGSEPYPPKPSIVRRATDPDGGWEITFLVDGSDPKGRI